MAQVYYPKKTTEKYVDGAIAGLLGGGIAVVVATIADIITPNQSWWTSLSIIGSIFTGATNFNTATPDWGSWLIGLVSTLIVFVLLGMGLVAYLPLFRRFRVHPILGGLAYGLLVWVFLDLLFLNGLTSGKLNLVVLLITDLIAGAAMAWWLSWAHRGQPGKQAEELGTNVET